MKCVNEEIVDIISVKREDLIQQDLKLSECFNKRR